MNGYGWCILRATPPSAHALASPDRLDAASAQADAELWTAFRAWMAQHAETFLRWDLVEQNNNDSGVLTFSVSRNHRASGVWAMLEWIAEHGRGSYGLFYVHDDEDEPDDDRYGRAGTGDANRFRVHRVLHGVVTEHDDPFFGSIWPDLEP